MKTYKNLYKQLCSWENLENAYRSARLHKTGNPKIQEFDAHWRLNLCVLMRELRARTYKPIKLKTFILRDPKTRKICVSEFRDRIVHHALVNILQPIFEPRFIHDSYASRKGKGTLTALNRFDEFKRKVAQMSISGGGERRKVFVLKADIKHYFGTVDHEILIRIIEYRIKDNKIVWLVRSILGNYNSGTPGKGMPLGNWTSQFFANVYLGELDQFVKHNLKARYYIRYVDDFVILHHSWSQLEQYICDIRSLLDTLQLELHPTKCSIQPLSQGVSFLGFRVYPNHRIPRKRNLRKIHIRITDLLDSYGAGQSDSIELLETLNGWMGYALQGDTYRLRKRMIRSVHSELERRTSTRQTMCHT